MTAKKYAIAVACILVSSGASSGQLIIGDNAKGVLSAPPPAPMSIAGVMGTPSESWIARETSGTVRQVLFEWATRAGWTFRPEHWTVPSDFPVHGTADFHGDFRYAVRNLLATTHQTSSPVQPCFYSNSVLRVIPINGMCDRSGLDVRK